MRLGENSGGGFDLGIGHGTAPSASCVSYLTDSRPVRFPSNHRDAESPALSQRPGSSSGLAMLEINLVICRFGLVTCWIDTLAVDITDIRIDIPQIEMPALDSRSSR